MKHTLMQTDGEDEIIIRYRQMTPEIESVIDFITGRAGKIIANDENGQVILDQKDILYIESVDNKTFAYTENRVYRLNYTLSSLDDILKGINYFRCSKSTIVNIDKIKRLKSLSSNRIDATLSSGEHIIISRTYATTLRRILKGEY